MVPPLTSFVWKYFEKRSPDSVCCTLCDKTLKYISCTTNMRLHLRARHKSVFKEECEKNNGVPTALGKNLNLKVEDKQVLSYEKLVIPTKMRSVYWKYFGFPATEDDEILTKEKVICCLCKAPISYYRNTSDIRLHLERKHPVEMEQLELKSQLESTEEERVPKKSKIKKAKQVGNLYSSNLDGSFTLNSRTNVSVDNNNPVSFASLGDFDGSEHMEGDQTSNVKVVSDKSKKSESPLLPDKRITLLVQDEDGQNVNFQSLHPFITPGESKNLCNAIEQFITVDIQCPDIVEGQGFQRLIATLKSPCEIPSKHNLVSEVIPRIYETYKESIKNTLRSLKMDMALTVEEWELASGETYVTFSVCHHDKHFTLLTKVLSTVYCPINVDASYWSLVFDNLLEEWNINVDKVKAVVCGSCRPGILEAMNIKGFVVVPCLIQTLQEVCSKVCFEQDEMREILTKCRTMICLIYNNSSALAALRIQDHLMSLEDTPLVSDYPQVWVSSYAMLEGMLARRQVISSVLDNVENNSYSKEMTTFSDFHWALIEDVITVLEPFKVTVLTLSEEKSPLVSLLKPLLWQLLVCHLQTKEDDSLNAQVFKAALKTLLSEKYTDPVVNDLLLTATTLDPRFKSLPYSVEECRTALDGPIKDILTTIIDQNPEYTESREEETTPKNKRPSGMAMLLGDITTSQGITSRDRASLEIVQYQSDVTAALDQCPIMWWDRAVAKCPNLARMAAQYNCIPATSLPSIRIPMEAQISYIIKRANLSPEYADKIVFINSNHCI